MTHQVVVGVDVGSGSARAVAIDRSGRVIATSFSPYQGGETAVGAVDPQRWLEGTLAALGGLGIPTPLAIGIGGHGPTTVSATGELALTFRYPIGESSNPRLQHEAHIAVLRHRFGNHVEPRQLWDWVLSRLGGRADSQSVWPPNEPLSEFGEPVPVGSVVGVTGGEFGLPAGIALVPGSHDAHMTAWGGGIDIPGRGFDPGGRTGGLGVAVEAGKHAGLASYSMPSPVSGVHIVGGPVAAHGALLDWWAGITGSPLSELLAEAESVPPGSAGVTALPFLDGERAPRWNPELRAEIAGLHLSHDRRVVTRALLESTAYGLGHIALTLRAQGVAIDRVVCSGAPSRSRLWCRIKAAVLEVPLDIPEYEQLACYGAALGAGSGIGWWPRPGSGVAGAWPRPAMTTVEPEPVEVYRRGLTRFIQAGDVASARLSRRGDSQRDQRP